MGIYLQFYVMPNIVKEILMLADLHLQQSVF